MDLNNPGKDKMRGKRRKHPASIIQAAADWQRCYLCMELYDDYSIKRGLHTHHVFGGTSGRQRSDEEGLTVRLCARHHARGGPEDVHGNAELAGMLHRAGQKAFERDHSRTEFMNIFHRNYLDDREGSREDPEEAGIKWLGNSGESLPWG